MNKSVVLVHPFSGNRTFVPPLGVLYVAAALRQADYTVRVLEMDLGRVPDSTVTQAISELDPVFVGITCNIVQVSEVVRLSRVVKAAGATVVVGGPMPTVVPERILKEPCVDICVRGEGEITAVELADAMHDGRDWRQIKGLSYRPDSDHVVHTPDRPFVRHLDSLPFPAHDLNLPPGAYSANATPAPATPLVAVLPARGCPFNCSFCSNVWRHQNRRRSAQNVVAELEWLVDTFGVKQVFFYDDTFNSNPAFVRELSQSIIDRHLHIGWRADCRANRKLVDLETLRLAKAAGCWLLAFGVESGNRRILERIRKQLKLEDVERARELCREAGILFRAFFMIGSPGEDYGTVFDTFNFARKLDVDDPQFSIFTPVVGTDAHAEALRNGWIVDDNWDNHDSFHATIDTDTLSREDVIALHEMAHLLFPQWWKPSAEGQRLHTPDVEQKLKHKYGRKGEMLWQMWQIHLRHGRLENPVVVVSPPDPPGITVGRDTMGGFGQTFRGEYAPVIPPVDMALLAGKVRAEGQPVVVIDANASKLDREHTLKFIAAMAPSKVYVRTTVPTRHWDETLADELRKKNRVDVELFGPAVGVSLLDSDLDSLPLPAWDLFPRYNLGPMTDGLDFLPINGSVGCPYACDYCPYPIAQGRKYRRRSPDLIVQEMRHWRDVLGVRHFIFRDPVFSLNREHVESICRGLVGEGITWRCETRADLLDQDLLRLMAGAGCTGLNIAIESTTEDVLGKVHRKAIDLDKVRETVRISKELDVRCFVFYVVGLPGETRESFLTTVEFARELDTPFVQFLPVMAYPGTALSAYASERGYIYDQLDAPPHYGSLPLMRNETLTREEIAELVRYGQHAVARRHLEKKQTRSNVAAAACRSYDDAEKAVRRAVDLLGGMAQFVGRGQRVLVKPNLIGSYSPDKAATTHPAVVEAVVRLVQEVGGIPIVGDSPGSGELAAYKDLSVVHRITGMAEVARRTGARLVDFSQGGVATIDLNGRVLRSVTVARAVLDADVIISVPKLKTHAFTYFTGAIKNIFGIVPGLGKAECHRLAPSPEEFGNLLIDLHLLLGDKLKLVVMDGIVGMEGRGPTHGQPQAGNFILAGRDSLHVDLVACNLVGLDHTQSVPLRVAMDRRNLDNVEVLLIGDSRESISAARFRAPLFESQDSFTATFAGIRPHIDPAVCQHCDRCRTACPMGAISESHVIDPERCIKCLCCFEMCKSSAVQLVRAAAGSRSPHAIKASADSRAPLPESAEPKPGDACAAPYAPSKRARVLLISNLYPPHFIGGYEVAAKDVADGLSARGYEVRVLTSMFGLDAPARNDGVARVLDHSYGRPGNSVMADPVFSAYNEYAIKAEVAGFSPDLIYLWNFHGLSMLSVMRTVLEAGIPYVFHAMDYHLVTKPGATPSWLENTIRAFLSQERCRTVVMSETVRGKFDACGFPNLRLVYHGVKQLFERTSPRSDALRLLFVGALVQGKGLHLLIQALEKVRAVDPRVTLDVYGAGDRDYENQLRRMVEDARLPVTFHGSVPHDEILPLYSNFDALVLPTLREEPFGIVMIEAMASGLPVIATSAGGPIEVVVPGETGYLFKLGNADDLAEAILRLVADRNQVTVMGNTARRLVQEKFLFEHTLDGIESVFREVVTTIRPEVVSLSQTSTKATAETVRPVPSEATESPSQGPGAARPILWAGAVLDPSGYADEVRNFVLELRAQGFHVAARCVTRHSKTFVRQLDSKTRMRLDEALTTRIQPGFVSVLHLPAYALQKVPDAAYNIGRTMFETDGLPPGWAARCNAMDEIWVPATFNLETFRNAGVTSRIVVVPGGIDVDRFRPGCKPLPVPGARGTVYLSIFEWIYRKGWDVLLRAWAEAFTPNDDVALVLRTYPLNAFDGHDAKQEINRRIDRFLQSEVGRSRQDVAPIIVLGEQVPEEDLPRLFAAANVYVAPSRGEGWGRPYMQAMACGLPVIATRWSGNLEFMNDENSLLLDIEGLVGIDERAELDFYRGQRWAEPSTEHLKELLRWVHENPTRAAAIGERARRDMVENWQWKHVAAIAAERLREISARLVSPRPVSSTTPASVTKPAVLPQAGRFTAVAASATEAKPNGDPGCGQVPLAVRWEGSQFVRHSLALVNRELCIKLAQDPGIELSIIPYEGHEFGPEVDPRFRLIADRMNRRLSRPADIHVRHQWPPNLTPPPEGRWVVIQPWEYGSIPSAWLEAWRDRIDDIWAYTRYVRDCYVRSGIPSDRVHVVPIGVDVEKFHPDARPLPLKTHKRFKFLFVGGTIWRKGIDVLLKAYTAVFGANDDVCLVIKDLGSQSFYRDNPLRKTIPHHKATANEPEIEYIDRTLDDEELAGLYAACDCLVHPYRGEGFGLPIVEAMASGLPVIVTGYGAATDFCGADTAFLIPARKVRGAGKLVGDLETVDKPWWAEPDLEALSKLLRFVVEHPAEAKARGKAARVHIESHFTWEHSARSIKERLQALSREPIRRQSPTAQLPATQRADSRETPRDLQSAARARFVEKWARQLASESSRREPLGVK